MPYRMQKWVAVLAVVALAGTALGDGVEGITRPSGDTTLSFSTPGRVENVLVKDGEAVKAGQVVVQLDDTVERAQLAQDEAAAQDETKIHAQEAVRDQKTVDLKRIQSLGTSATPFEVDRRGWM